MLEKTYPCSYWILLPSFAPMEVTLSSSGRHWGVGNHQSTSGRLYHDNELYPSRRAAVDAGWLYIADQEAGLKKRAEEIDSRKVTLTKHSAAL